MDRAANITLSRRGLLGLGMLGAAAGIAGCSPGVGERRSSPAHSASPTPSAGWETVWEDDFSEGLDPAFWTAADYGGNRDLNEQQYNDPALVSVENGNLVLRAQPEGRDGYAFRALMPAT